VLVHRREHLEREIVAVLGQRRTCGFASLELRNVTSEMPRSLGALAGVRRRFAPPAVRVSV
jgi:hypothetical protein